jgi:hypothetical protein
VEPPAALGEGQPGAARATSRSHRAIVPDEITVPARAELGRVAR